MDISFIIPVYNEELYIGGCIESIVNVMSGRDITYEIIVIDNGSNDSSGNVASSYPGVKVLTISRTSVAKARNNGADVSDGSVLAFIDSDVVLEPGWGEAIDDLLCRDSDQHFLTGCQYGIRKEPSWIERYWFGSMKSSHINGGNLIISRSAFHLLGGFDAELKTGEDVDLCDRASLASGIHYYIDHRFSCIHLGYPRNIRQFLKREIWHGEGDFRSLRDFLKSQVAIVSMVYGSFFFTISALFAIQQGQIALSVMIVFVTMNLLITYRRFDEQSIRFLIFNSIINFFYFFARFFSLFRSIARRKLEY